jgi:hypothetical protein
MKVFETYSVSMYRRLHSFLNRKIGAGRSVQFYLLNSVTHIAMFRTSFVKTNTLHRVTTKTPNLLRWGHSYHTILACILTK